MIEKTIIDALRGDATLVSLVTKYRAKPAIFSELAPEPVKEPYITINISRNPANDDLVVQEFVIMINVWGRENSRVNVRRASERIEFIFDNKQFNSDARYDTIRTWFVSGGWVEEADPRDVHYNHQFTARAGRKKWINNTL